MTTDPNAAGTRKSFQGNGLGRSLAALACLVTLPLTPGCNTGPSSFDERIMEIEDLTRDRLYIEAAEASVLLVEDTPIDSPLFPQAEEAQRTVSLASQLDRAREMTLADEDEAALDLLTQLHEQYPSSRQVAAWRGRTSRKLSDRWFSIAREARAAEEFDAARAAYMRALNYDPDHPVAALSLEDLQALETYRAGLGADYYNGGVRGVVDGKLSEARSGFEKSLKYDGDNDKTKRRITEVDRELAIDRAASAQARWDEELYGAAALEFAMAVAQDPESAELQAKLEAAEAEAKASVLRSEADFLILRGEIDRAEELLVEGAAMTTLQKDDFAAAMAGINDARTDLLYEAALDLEHDFRFPEAITAFKAILESRGFYKDSRARVDSLEGYVATAERLYSEAKDANSDSERLNLLQQIDVFWPEYRDVAEKIRALKKK